jgi:alpha-tubulin suppressor-like RCC1 family protein
MAGHPALGGAPGGPVPGQVGSHTWKSVVAGTYHTCGVRSDDTLWCWGGGGDVLGLGEVSVAYVPTQVGTDTWKMVDTTTTHTCGVRSDNTLWCWGWNHAGQLGQGATEPGSSGVPLQVGTLTTWTSVTVGYNLTLGLKM